MPDVSTPKLSEIRERRNRMIPDRLMRDVPALLAALDAVLDRHKPDAHGWCWACNRPAPCGEINRINEHIDVEG